ncbi:MAG: hypothetical protein Q9168_005512 [Polycauliona sp. 1 TL-2023]
MARHEVSNALPAERSSAVQDGLASEQQQAPFYRQQEASPTRAEGAPSIGTPSAPRGGSSCANQHELLDKLPAAWHGPWKQLTIDLEPADLAPLVDLCNRGWDKKGAKPQQPVTLLTKAATNKGPYCLTSAFRGKSPVQFQGITEGEACHVCKAKEHHDIWVRSIQNQIDQAKQSYAESSMSSEGSVAAQRFLKHIQRLQKELINVRSAISIDAEYAHGDSEADVPPALPYYDDLSIEQAYQFWNQRLDLDTAINIWRFAYKAVPIEQNLLSENIGFIITQTFVVIAHNSWRAVIQKRFLNESVRAHLVHENKAQVV